MTNRIKADSLNLEPTTLPATGTNGEVRLDTATNSLKLWKDGVWANIGGGSGVIALAWNDSEGTAPLQAEANGEVEYLFEDGLDQSLKAWLKVPSNYVAGQQIVMQVAGYSLSGSNTITMAAQSILVRNNVDAADSTANLDTLTPATLTNTVSEAIRVFSFNVTNASGEIDSLAVSPNDFIRLSLFRGTGTDTADIHILPSATEVSFNA